MKSCQHRTNILEVRTVGKRSAVIGKPVRQSFIVKHCRVGRDCGYDLFTISVVCGIGNVVRLSYPAWGHSWRACGHSWTAYGWSWSRINITIASCLIGVTFTFSYISSYVYTFVYICLSLNNLSILMSWGRQNLVNRVNEKESKL